MTAADRDLAAETVVLGHHRVVHLVCCHQKTAICGTNVTALYDVPDATPVTCAGCDAADESGDTCGALFCRARQWLREHLGRAR